MSLLENLSAPCTRRQVLAPPESFPLCHRSQDAASPTQGPVPEVLPLPWETPCLHLYGLILGAPVVGNSPRNRGFSWAFRQAEHNSKLSGGETRGASGTAPWSRWYRCPHLQAAEMRRSVYLWPHELLRAAWGACQEREQTPVLKPPRGFRAPSQGLDASVLNRDQFCAFHSQTQGLNHTHSGVHGSGEERQGALGKPARWAPSPVIPKVALGWGAGTQLARAGGCCPVKGHQPGREASGEPGSCSRWLPGGSVRSLSWQGRPRRYGLARTAPDRPSRCQGALLHPMPVVRGAAGSTNPEAGALASRTPRVAAQRLGTPLPGLGHTVTISDGCPGCSVQKRGGRRRVELLGQLEEIPMV